MRNIIIFPLLLLFSLLGGLLYCRAKDERPYHALSDHHYRVTYTSPEQAIKGLTQQAAEVSFQLITNNTLLTWFENQIPPISDVITIDDLSDTVKINLEQEKENK